MKLQAPTLRLFDGLDWNSPGLVGPFHMVADCLYPHGEVPAITWWDKSLPIRSGDTAVWYLPSNTPGPQPPRGAAWMPQGLQECTKWFYVLDGVEWVVCKYFAVKRRPDFHVPFARLVAELRYPPGWHNNTDPVESQRLGKEMRDLRAHPPRRPDVVVFREGQIC